MQLNWEKKMSDYFCTAEEVGYLKTITPEMINEFYNYDDDLPEGHVLIHVGVDTYCLASVNDFRPGTFIEPVTSIEYFEKGIPEWMGILPNRSYYIADWDGSEWSFTKTIL